MVKKVMAPRALPPPPPPAGAPTPVLGPAKPYNFPAREGAPPPPAVAGADVHLGLIEELHGRSSRNRSTGTDEAMARMRHRPTPVHWKPHFSSTRREAGLLTRALAVRTS